jgi:hypothetical protein
MKLFSSVCLTLLIACGTGSLPPGLTGGSAEQAAIKAAEDWLRLFDAADYSATWDTAGSLFQSQITKQRWRESAGTARSPLGAVTTRAVRNASYSMSLPGAPDGEYVTITYDTAFANKAAGVETAVVMRDPSNGKWQVVGYFVR